MNTNLSSRIEYGCIILIVLAYLSMAWSYSSVQNLPVTIWQVSFGMLAGLWVLAILKEWGVLASVILTAYLTAAAAGFLLGGIPFALLASAVLALSAWDLERLARLFQQAGRVENSGNIIKGHLIRLVLVDAAGLAAASMALLPEIQLGFLTTVILALFAIVLLSFAIRRLRLREG
jgi:hypothetical protein